MRWFGKLKQQRRIATRYDKTVLSFESFLNLAAARLSPEIIHSVRRKRLLLSQAAIHGLAGARQGLVGTCHAWSVDCGDSFPELAG